MTHARPASFWGAEAARVAAREDEEAAWTAAMNSLADTHDGFRCSYCGEDTTECRQAARHGGPCGA